MASAADLLPIVNALLRIKAASGANCGVVSRSLEGRMLMRFLLLIAIAVSTRAAEPFAAAEEASKRFVLPPGFKSEVFAAEPMLANPVAFSIDEKGRIFVAETY